MHDSLKTKGVIYKNIDKRQHKHNFLPEKLASYNNNYYNFKCMVKICLILVIILIY